MAARPDPIQQATEYMRLGMQQAAQELLKGAAQKQPRNAQIAHLLGLALMQANRAADATRELERAVELEPGAAGLRVTLGNALAMQKRFAAAAESYRRAIRLQSNNAPAHLGLALVLPRLDDVMGAVEAGREALRLTPNQFQPYVNLSTALKESGQAEEAVGVLSEARRRFPDKPHILSLLLAARNYCPDSAPSGGVELARAFGKLVGPPDAHQWPNAPDPDRRLRVGYLSADIRNHSVAYFLEPILRCHDRDAIEVLAYCDSPIHDATTERLRALCDGWRDIAGVPAQQVVEQIRADTIDVLIELGGHTNNNRLEALARRVAPVQASYLGYPSTTGVPAIDHRLIDAVTDPPGSEEHATEDLVRLPGCFLCYQPPADAPDVADSPHLTNGDVTFGSFNSMPKTGRHVIEAWARVLKRVPDSRLFLKNRSLGDPRLQARVRDQFGEHGIEPQRIEFAPSAATPAEHLAMYARIDIALDTFPYNGTTTTCEALWMGVPVVTFEGSVHAARVSASLLQAAGLPELAAPSREAWIERATHLASERERLREWRRTLRHQLANSPLCDAPAFTRGLERALRIMWQRWCADQVPQRSATRP